MTYRIIEFLEHYVDIDPVLILGWLGKFVGSARQTGFQYELAAAPKLVDLMQLYLTDHFALLGSEQREIVVDILDAFIEGGSTRAIQLVYRLDEMMR